MKRMFSFQPTSVIADGRSAATQRNLVSLGVFQPTSVIADGRSSVALVSLPATTCFNPRPSLLTDEAASATDFAGHLLVSTHVRHC